MTDIKPNLGPHSGEATTRMTFEEVFTLIQEAPPASFTTEGGKDFLVTATVGQKGKHAGERVLKFMDGTTERARAYVCCWGHQTNCNSQHIDLYSEAISPEALSSPATTPESQPETAPDTPPEPAA